MIIVTMEILDTKRNRVGHRMIIVTIEIPDTLILFDYIMNELFFDYIE